jgi:hypothetical protein
MTVKMYIQRSYLMKLFLSTILLLASGLFLPGCDVRSVGVYEEHPRDFYTYDYNYHRPYARPYSPYSRRPVVVHDRPVIVHERRHDRAGVEFHVSD